MPEPGAVRQAQAPASIGDGPHAAGQPALDMRLPASPVLTLRSGSVTLVQVSVHLRTGRLLLRAGDESHVRPEVDLIMHRVRAAAALFLWPLGMVCTPSKRPEVRWRPCWQPDGFLLSIACAGLSKRSRAALEGTSACQLLRALLTQRVSCVQDEDKLASIRAESLRAATQQPGLVAAEGMAKVCGAAPRPPT